MAKEVLIPWLAMGGLLAWSVWRRRRSDAKSPASGGYAEGDIRVTLDDQGVVSTRPDGLVESVRWEDLVQVDIMTTDAGPWAEDAFWILHGTDRKSGCVIPNGATGVPELMKRLDALSGYRTDVVIEAMGSTSNRTFVCWKKEIRP